MLRNHYEFDWNIVAKLDPTYIKFLEDVNQIELKADSTWGLNPGDPNVHGLTARELRQREAQQVEVNLNTDWRSKQLSDDEKAIINMMHNNAIKEKPQGELVEDDMVCELIDSASTDSEKDPVLPNYRLKEEYCNYPVAEHPDVLMLTPPKKVLGEGSKFWIGSDIQYTVSGSAERNNPDVVVLTKYKIYHKYLKVGLLKAHYRFDRLRDTTAEIRKHFRMMVYNLDTAKLYYITAEQKNGKGKKVTKKITQMSLNRNGTQAVISTFDGDLSKRFVNIVMDHVLTIIPDAYIPLTHKAMDTKKMDVVSSTSRIQVDYELVFRLDTSSHRANVMYAMMIQHKVGRRLEWLNDNHFLEHISEFAGRNDLASQFIGGPDTSDKSSEEAVTKREKAFKKKTLYTVIAKLKERPGAKTVTRALFGKYYKNIYHKLLTGHDDQAGFQDAIGFLIDISYTISNGTLPNNTYHLIVKLIKLWGLVACAQLGQLRQAIYELRGNTLRWGSLNRGSRNDEETLNKNIHMVELYTRTIMNVLKKTNLVSSKDIVKWDLFRDTLRMASELGIRVRINKFTCARNVQVLHDRFSVFQQRDLEVFNRFDIYKFLEFKSPTKEYGGFRFIQLLTPADLVEEGRIMHHCAAGYSPQCLNGTSIMFSMFKEGRSWLTIELNGSESKCAIRQKYTIKDFTIRNSTMLDILKRWHSDVVDMHSRDKHPYVVKAAEYYEYQKNEQRLKKYQGMNKDDLSTEEKRWLEQTLQKAQEVLEISAVKMNLEEVPDATSLEQVYATA